MAGVFLMIKPWWSRRGNLVFYLKETHVAHESFGYKPSCSAGIQLLQQPWEYTGWKEHSRWRYFGGVKQRNKSGFPAPLWNWMVWLLFSKKSMPEMIFIHDCSWYWMTFMNIYDTSQFMTPHLPHLHWFCGVPGRHWVPGYLMVPG